MTQVKKIGERLDEVYGAQRRLTEFLGRKTFVSFKKSGSYRATLVVHRLMSYEKSPNKHYYRHLSLSINIYTSIYTYVAL